MNTKRVDPKMIAEEMVRAGFIPEAYKDEFARTLDYEMGRETRRLASDMAVIAARGAYVKQLLAA
jgi:hypothetical protein